MIVQNNDVSSNDALDQVDNFEEENLEPNDVFPNKSKEVKSIKLS